MSILDRILEVKRAEVAAAKSRLSPREIEERAKNAAPVPAFVGALQKKNPTVSA